MKLSLAAKLVFSYCLIAIFLVASLLLVSNYFFQKQFEVYLAHKQEMKNQEVVNLIASSYTEGGTPPGGHFFETLGNTLLEQGIVLMVYDTAGTELFCVTKQAHGCCERESGGMEAYMKETFPGYSGEYTEDKIDFFSDKGLALGGVTLGYYGPFYIDEGEHNFISRWSGAFLATGAVFLAAAIGIGFFMASKISAPLQKVTQQAKSIAEGNYGQRIAETTNTAEIDALSASIDHLAESLQTQLALKKRMAGDYSHEFRTPLTALQTNLEAMIDGLWQPTPERLEGLRGEITRLGQMVSEVDRLVEVQSRPVQLNKTSYDVTEQAAGVARAFESEIQKKGLAVLVEGGACFIWADYSRFGQVLVNLVSNAVKYTPPGGRVVIEAKNTAKGTRLTVQDTGAGIDEADRPYIFDHLYRADTSRTRETGGSGIGLSVAREIVQAHGGSIAVQGAAGGGSCFVVLLPGEEES